MGDELNRADPRKAKTLGEASQNPDGTYKSPETLRAAFEAAGVDLALPLTATCGSGVTASVLLFALHLLGVDTAALYDGSWSEWSADPATPKQQGPNP